MHPLNYIHFICFYAHSVDMGINSQNPLVKKYNMERNNNYLALTGKTQNGQSNAMQMFSADSLGLCRIYLQAFIFI